MAEIDRLLVAPETASTIERELKRTSKITRGRSRGRRRRGGPRGRHAVVQVCKLSVPPLMEGTHRFFPAEKVHVADPFLPDIYESHPSDPEHHEDIWVYPLNQNWALPCEGMMLLCWIAARYQSVGGDERPVYLTDWQSSSARFELRETLPAESFGPAFFTEYDEDIEVRMHNMCGEIEVTGEPVKIIGAPRSCNEPDCSCNEWETIVVCCPPEA